MKVTSGRWAAAVAALSITLAGQAAAADNITVFAAASLTNALQEIAGQYQQGKPVRIVSSFASSSTLARQIEQGAPADLFISADQQWMDYAAEKNTIENNSRYTLLGNDLVLVAAKAEKKPAVTITKQTDWKSLLKGQRLAVGDPQHVPAGLYAKEALQNLGAWDTVSPMLAPGNSVRAALALVERNEAPYGIVYGSDAVASDKVTVVGHFPESSHKPVEYPMAIVKDHDNTSVQAFYRYLKGPQAAAIFKKYGFTPR
ncbi:molybdate ABC transporter substrate-binding protein [Erwinia sp. OLTSP20]|uniref:molybdate ABC transporter substrate-binding protein n=1 Tax=unclassified Erwinia TaxID=2622719 RepID=UPI000C1952C4|nr:MULTISPECIES: molybdate ABC transporter substrate-binding protein [unclassified Erwinia]PIJ48733.1 molybdate ABC transporter substrate-binding protein [Erwinia sp. OAMSP11]PIJ69358.1 molybdate ABC transporter substrate-binding protein [Erwinia sp. OLSSP12]PIJ79192.1 molybdate ABC transporter substrate-binding protein [Erwinia sp. OLCASP19]PIJ80718.1 molybdate ABC transporter substrate-binding protein [Erwinia sp. OLMTSP26]PIJ82868.1 molybdate ABC transporter substrate-binding protein [Erwin